MNIKSLLIGSAAALAVVSGAQAADAVVAAEPEPMEYVRVCDAYGTGFFYIPGTETCLKIGGKVRFEKNYEKQRGRDDLGIKNKAYYDWHTRTEMDFEARNDSEWGTVYSWIRLRSDDYNNSPTDFTSYYYMGIGGFEIGRYESPGTRFQEYGGRTDWAGYYGEDHDHQYVSYTATFDSFSAFIALENDLEDGGNYNYYADRNSDGVIDTLVRNQKRGDGGRTYMPDVSAGIKGQLGDYSAGAFIGYDESDESFNVRKWVRGDIGMFGFTVMGLYSNSADNVYFQYDGFSVIAGVSAKVTDTITIAKDVQWWDDDSWRVIGDVAWEVAPGFSVLVEGSYGDGKSVGNRARTGMLRIDRTF